MAVPDALPSAVQAARTKFLLKFFPTFVRPPVTSAAKEHYAADRELADGYETLLADAADAEGTLGEAQAADRPYEEIAERSRDLDRALAAVVRAAEAAERVAVGIRGYNDSIYRRKRLAHESVLPWGLELRRLRTVREAYRLAAMGRTGTLVAGSVRVGNHATLTPHNESVGAGQPDDAAEGVGDPRIGVDLAAAISRRSAVRGVPPARRAS
ncbi:MAG: hypothetical protein ACRDN9_19500 [Streptosporangiaceae bacterium]